VAMMIRLVSWVMEKVREREWRRGKKNAIVVLVS